MQQSVAGDVPAQRGVTVRIDRFPREILGKDRGSGEQVRNCGTSPPIHPDILIVCLLNPRGV